MSNINNQTKDLFAIATVEELDNETAAACSGGVAYLYSNDPDVILYKDPNGQGQALNANASTGDGISNVGFTSGNGSGGQETTFNDTVSSITIKNGVWSFFQDDNYSGDTTGLLGPGTYNLGHNDDKITSFFRNQ